MHPFSTTAAATVCSHGVTLGGSPYADRLKPKPGRPLARFLSSFRLGSARQQVKLSKLVRRRGDPPHLVSSCVVIVAISPGWAPRERIAIRIAPIAGENFVLLIAIARNWQSGQRRASRHLPSSEHKCPQKFHGVQCAGTRRKKGQDSPLCVQSARGPGSRRR
jgi:hypothetical protein